MRPATTATPLASDQTCSAYLQGFDLAASALVGSAAIGDGRINELAQTLTGIDAMCHEPTALQRSTIRQADVRFLKLLHRWYGQDPSTAAAGITGRTIPVGSRTPDGTLQLTDSIRLPDIAPACSRATTRSGAAEYAVDAQPASGVAALITQMVRTDVALAITANRPGFDSVGALPSAAPWQGLADAMRVELASWVALTPGDVAKAEVPPPPATKRVALAKRLEFLLFMLWELVERRGPRSDDVDDRPVMGQMLDAIGRTASHALSPSALLIAPPQPVARRDAGALGYGREDLPIAQFVVEAARFDEANIWAWQATHSGIEAIRRLRLDNRALKDAERADAVAKAALRALAAGVAEVKDARTRAVAGADFLLVSGLRVEPRDAVEHGAKSTADTAADDSTNWLAASTGLCILVDALRNRSPARNCAPDTLANGAIEPIMDGIGAQSLLRTDRAHVVAAHGVAVAAIVEARRRDLDEAARAGRSIRLPARTAADLAQVAAWAGQLDLGSATTRDLIMLAQSGAPELEPWVPALAIQTIQTVKREVARRCANAMRPTKSVREAADNVRREPAADSRAVLCDALKAAERYLAHAEGVRNALRANIAAGRSLLDRTRTMPRHAELERLLPELEALAQDRGFLEDPATNPCRPGGGAAGSGDGSTAPEKAVVERAEKAKAAVAEAERAEAAAKAAQDLALTKKQRSDAVRALNRVRQQADRARREAELARRALQALNDEIARKAAIEASKAKPPDVPAKAGDQDGVVVPPPVAATPTTPPAVGARDGLPKWASVPIPGATSAYEMAMVNGGSANEAARLSRDEVQSFLGLLPSRSDSDRVFEAMCKGPPPAAGLNCSVCCRAPTGEKGQFTVGYYQALGGKPSCTPFAVSPDAACTPVRRVQRSPAVKQVRSP